MPGRFERKAKPQLFNSVPKCPECATVVFTFIGICTNASAKTTMLGYAEIVAMH